VVSLLAAAGLVGCSGTTGGAPSAASTRPLDGCAPTTETVDFTTPRWGDDRAILHVAGCPTNRVDVIYLLHGANADRTQWTDIGVVDAVDRYIAEHGGSVVVVIPDAAGAYSCRASCEALLADYVLDEVEPLVTDRGFEVGRRLIAGISRGGRYALGVASAHPDAFVAVAAHSPANVPPTTFEVLAGQDLPIWIDAGDADPLAPSVSDLVSLLDSGAPAVSASIQTGGHDRAYWRRRVPEYVAWYLRQFPVPIDLPS
jgi:enterochelin esterase family protein